MTELTIDFITRIEGFNELGINAGRKLVILRWSYKSRIPCKKLQSALKIKPDDSVTFLYSKFLDVLYDYLTRLTWANLSLPFFLVTVDSCTLCSKPNKFTRNRKVHLFNLKKRFFRFYLLELIPKTLYKDWIKISLGQSERHWDRFLYHWEKRVAACISWNQ